MLKNIFLSAIRNLWRHKGYSIINIVGLSIGIACAMIIYLYVNLEMSYDRFYPDYDRIYRVVSNVKTNSMDYERPTAAPPVAKILLEDFPQVETAMRYSRGMKSSVRYKDTKVYTDRPFRIDQNFFKFFPRKIVKGLKKSQVERPNTAIITESFARILFGDEDPIGKMVVKDSIKYELTAIIEDWPQNSHIHPDILCSWNPDPYENTDMDWMTNGWGGQAFTFIKLREDTDVESFDQKIENIAANYNPDPQDSEGIKRIVYHYTQALKDIHLKPHTKINLQPAGNSSYLKIFVVIGLLVLLIACINYMNLTTAKFMKRSREIGIRKTVGASRKLLIFQFLFESFIYVFIAHVIAMFLVELCLPYVNQLLETKLFIDYSNLYMLISIFLLILFTSIVSGSYPAFFLSSFRPIAILNGKIKTGFLSIWIRKGLVIFQFAVSVGLIISVMMIYKQISFMKSYPLGFDKEQKLILRFPRDVIKYDEYRSIKQEFLSIPQVNEAAFCSSIPGEWNYGWRTYLPGEENIRTFLINYYQVDESFSDLIGLEIIAGTSLLPEHLGNGIMEIIINEAALKTIGWESPEEAVGKSIWSNDREIVGVFKNFHFKGLQEEVGPMGIFHMSDDFKLLVLDLNTNDYSAAISSIEDAYNCVMPDYPFEYFFMDQNFDKQYKAEEKMGEFLSILSILGVFIACIGLLGLASFMTQQRTKEIGIRKVNGAGISDILLLFVGSFSKWILIANIIAWPIVYFLLSKWLENFAYQSSISWWIFVIAGILSLFLSTGTVLYQSYKAAKSNPVEAIKYE